VFLNAGFKENIIDWCSPFLIRRLSFGYTKYDYSIIYEEHANSLHTSISFQSPKKAPAKLRLDIYYLRKSVFLIFLNN
jgi:hypothetical protein